MFYWFFLKFSFYICRRCCHKICLTQLILFQIFIYTWMTYKRLNDSNFVLNLFSVPDGAFDVRSLFHTFIGGWQVWFTIIIKLLFVFLNKIIKSRIWFSIDYETKLQHVQIVVSKFPSPRHLVISLWRKRLVNCQANVK